jgi:hypothetical protein
VAQRGDGTLTSFVPLRKVDEDHHFHGGLKCFIVNYHTLLSISVGIYALFGFL